MLEVDSEEPGSSTREMRGRALMMALFSGLCTLVVVSIVISTATSTCDKVHLSVYPMRDLQRPEVDMSVSHRCPLRDFKAPHVLWHSVIFILHVVLHGVLQLTGAVHW